MNPLSTRITLHGWQIGIAIVLVIAVLSLSIPGVRASISQWLGLSIAPSNEQPVAAVTLVAITPPTPAVTAPAVQPQATQTQPIPSATPAATATLTNTPGSSTAPRPTAVLPAEVSTLAPQVGWDILMPAKLPEGYKLESAYLDTNHNMLAITYTATRPLPGSSLTATQSITLLEALKNDFVPMQLAPDAHLTDVTVNGQPGVYVIGAWDTQFVPDAKDPNGGQMVSTWRNDLNVKNLYWQVGKVYLAIVTPDEGVSQQDLMDMAGSMR